MITAEMFVFSFCLVRCCALPINLQAFYYFYFWYIDDAKTSKQSTTGSSLILTVLSAV